MRNESLWSATAKLPTFRTLQDNIQADVCIVGAGISGLTTAYLLSQTGKSVVVIDDGELASGMTAATTAHLSSVLDDRYFEIERIHGEAGARLAAQSHTAAINRIESIVQKESIHCDFYRVNGYLFRAPDQKEDIIEKELDAAKRAGLRDAVVIDRAPFERFDTGRCIAFPNQAQFHPLKYLAGVAQAIERDGGRIYTHTHADSIEGGDAARIQTGKHVIVADAVVVATNAPINDRVAIHTKQAPYMSYVIGARVKPGSVKRALYWDMLDSYHYVRLQDVDDHEILIVGGEDHKSGQADDTEERHGRLEAWARERFPSIQEIEFAWAGQVMETHDGLAFIGHNPLDKENVYVVTGDSGMGMTHGTIAGILLTDLILGRKNPWEKLYDPARKVVRAAGTFARETLNMAAQFVDWVKTGEVVDVDEIPKGGGAILRRGVGMVAAYRNDEGELHERSAVCNHLGCIVHWNAAASTWDCPCHGSRFDKMGKVFNGPANRDLASLTPSKLRTG